MPLMAEWISDADDPRIAGYRDVRERDLVGRSGLFVAEGQVVLRALLESRTAEPVSILVAESRLSALSGLLETAGDGIQVFVASQAVMDRIVGFPIHRGILALGRKPGPGDLASILGKADEGALVLALSGISNHDNMGGLFRNAAAFGVDAVALDSDCCDPFYRKALRVSVGGVLKTPHVRFGPDADLVGSLQAQGLRVLALSPAGERPLASIQGGGRLAVLLGAEGAGLSPEVLARCETVRIPMAAGFDSLNVATTSGIVLHHLRSGSTDAG
ncbi:RNA methyltransferase [Phenylobacterium sp.]|jgi:tRNA G18 (ribose-2'-O)-methylase SpoU|uniref:TrmH family RNA methyltransferase n=1 Tax=Phenylobacterium sp. TaxID=1871053 RepID=UPI0025CB8572|nr:RNA methyltransferase [Phenylobacterium sp.]MCA3721220.1 RNA methyltransferase [Phenylobacterium sp.]